MEKCIRTILLQSKNNATHWWMPFHFNFLVDNSVFLSLSHFFPSLIVIVPPFSQPSAPTKSNRNSKMFHANRVFFTRLMNGACMCLHELWCMSIYIDIYFQWGRFYKPKTGLVCQRCRCCLFWMVIVFRPTNCEYM